MHSDSNDSGDSGDSHKTGDLPAEVIAALTQGNKIEAIKILRQARNIDLKQAKDIVDAYVQGQPALQRKFAAASLDAKRGCLSWLLFFAALLIAGYYVFTVR